MDTIYRRMMIYSLFLLLFTTAAIAQDGYKTIVKLTDLSNEAILQKMQTNATEMLSGINEAYFQNRKPDLKDGTVTNEAREILTSLWETSPFRCSETQIIERVLLMTSKKEKTYQVRNIPVFIKNVFDENDSASAASEEAHYHEICLTFNNKGIIENIFYSLEANSYKNLLNQGASVTDIRRREFILDFIENFRTAYNRKDIEFLQKVFSEDALIITGKIIKAETSDMMNRIGGLKVEYQKQTKKEYMDKLKTRVFKYNKYIDVVFEGIKITEDRGYPEIYGVNLKQYWTTTSYKDVGYLFLMIDFKDDNNPVIHVRTWQPEEITKTDQEIFDLGSFNIER